jgi:diguanylate cyclase (GGDEF)-like protein/PAS domain S-box-containing protein
MNMASYMDLHACIVENMFDGVCYVDVERRVLLWNKAAENITGYVSAEVLGHLCCDRLYIYTNENGESLCRKGCHFIQAIHSGRTYEDDVYLKGKQGQRIAVNIRVIPMFDEQGQVVGAVEIFREIISAVRDENKIRTLAKLAYVDSLTELANSQYMENKLHIKLEELKNGKATFGVVLIRINEFKEFNETYGNDVGDKILKAIAKQLAKIMNYPDTAGRWQGTHFLVFSQNDKKSILTLLTNKISASMGKSSVWVDGENITYSVSIGATMAEVNDTVATVVNRLEKQLPKTEGAASAKANREKTGSGKGENKPQ